MQRPRGACYQVARTKGLGEIDGKSPRQKKKKSSNMFFVCFCFLSGPSFPLPFLACVCPLPTSVIPLRRTSLACTSSPGTPSISQITKAAQRSMNLLFVLHPPAEAGPLEQLGKQTQNLQSKAHSLWVTCSLMPVYRADVKKQYRVWMPRIATSLEKYFSSPAPSTPGRWIANTWGGGGCTCLGRQVSSEERF